MSKSEKEHYAYQYGSDAQFLDWVSRQPSVIDGAFNQYDPPRNIPCHVRRIKDGAGLGIKPPFSAVPMTDTQHKIQSHHDGEKILLALSGIRADLASKWFEEQRDRMVERWIASRLMKKSVKSIQRELV